ncbi:DUF3800 domain-containing protein [Riemerella anatipestifer]|uniref:DUF3800 domain-containing protein n=4 Tax=Riemerella anatipestifer TaxID=34085 RepID=J9QZA2_RIEAN|nr:DUF3800 domain-containing protein [Riemerella anatipestifer]WCS66396.1 hypothetical protein CRP5_000041 [Riemerella phage vB_RanS_CRP5]WIL01294.1 hypothetical protein CRP6_000014 [Riemerella phage vB_RanS_CRP6]WIR86143.1 hypothetical protein CRP12_000012 [Riemerella phage vB_RanS_CRP12]WIT94441.1 hypothetical protein CRP19_000010 [Riemerella phage vB_RanS_CRP19]AFR35970.1 hypothetical protein B739_1372 [Riemerella anatipestifer RA-CH-1]
MAGFYIFCDESIKKGKYYSNFYGGLLIDKNDFEKANNLLLSSLRDLNIENSELKWSSVNTYGLQSYVQMMNVFFELIKNNTIKVRIMFTDNRFLTQDLPREYHKKEYHLLYYQFLKHAFGLSYINSDIPIDLEIFFDELPDKKQKNEDFKKFVYGIQFLPNFISSKINIKKEAIYEVDSKKHLLMQCLDVVLGAIAFRLNDMHKEKPVGSRRRGKRTIAKEKLYKHINKKIREIRPNFNIGITTGTDGDLLNRFLHPYRHWLFIPKNASYGTNDEDE